MATPRRATIAAAAAMTITLLAGACTTSPDSPVEGTSKSSRPTRTNPNFDDGERTDQGYVAVPEGRRAIVGVESSTVEEATKFVVESVEVDPPCSSFMDPPEDGHTLLVTFRITTGSDKRISDRLRPMFVQFAFSELTRDGTTVPVRRGICTDEGWSMPHRYAPNSEYVGTVELVVPEASGTLLMDNLADRRGGGWEWSYDVPGGSE